MYGGEEEEGEAKGRQARRGMWGTEGRAWEEHVHSRPGGSTCRAGAGGMVVAITSQVRASVSPCAMARTPSVAGSK